DGEAALSGARLLRREGRVHPARQRRAAEGRGEAAREERRGRRVSGGRPRLLLQRARVLPEGRGRGLLAAAEGVLREASPRLSPMRILLVGQAAFADEVLRGLEAAGHTIAAVVCPLDAGPKPDPV